MATQLVDASEQPIGGNRRVNVSRLTIGFSSLVIIGGLIAGIAVNGERTAENARRLDKVEAVQANTPSRDQVNQIAEDVRFLVRREIDRGTKK